MSTRRSRFDLLRSLNALRGIATVAGELLAPVHRMSVREAVAAFATVAAAHVPINPVGYAVGARATPI